MTETEINTCNIIRDVIIDVLINYDGNTQERVQGGELQLVGSGKTREEVIYELAI